MYWSEARTFVAKAAPTNDATRAPTERAAAIKGLEYASLLDNAAEGERNRDQPDCPEHAFHAAAREQLVDSCLARMRDVTSGEG